jgi:hypothetical protein
VAVVGTRLFIAKPVLIAGILGILLAFASVAGAEEPVYCRKVRARAAGEAALLIAPKVVGQVIHFPSDGRLDATTETNSPHPLEFRAGLSVSPVDMLRGMATLRVADADCVQHTAEEDLDEWLRQDTDLATLPGRRAEAQYLRAHRPEWQALLENGENRLKAGIVTVMELYDLRRLGAELERRTIQVEGEVARLEAKLNAAPTPGQPATDLARTRGSVRDYVASTRALEEAASSLRSFDAWSFRITGGVAPAPDRPIDWFGFAELTYSLGGIPQTNAESRYLAARDQEVRQSSSELPGKVAQLRNLVLATQRGVQRELEAVELELSGIQRTLAELEGFDAPDAVQGRARLTIEHLSLEADAVFLRTEARELNNLAGAAP